MGSVGTIMRSSGAEDNLIETGLCKQGTTNKCFTVAGDYYQSMRAHKLPREAMANLHIDGFGKRYLDRKDGAHFSGLAYALPNISDLLGTQRNGGSNTNETRFPLDSVYTTYIQMVIYDEECKRSPIHVLWRACIKTIDILLRFIASHCAGNWEKSLAESNNMVPCIIDDCHHNYI